MAASSFPPKHLFAVTPTSEQEMHATNEAAYWFCAFGAEEVGGTVAGVETYEVYRALDPSTTVSSLQETNDWDGVWVDTL